MQIELQNKMLPNCSTYQLERHLLKMCKKPNWQIPKQILRIQSVSKEKGLSTMAQQVFPRVALCCQFKQNK